MPDRFFYAGPWLDEVNLVGDEAHHLARVLRAEPGDRVELFDGCGNSAPAEVVSVRKQMVTLRLLSAPVKHRLLLPEIILAVASPKGDRLRWMIEKVTELGVDRLVLLQTDRGVVHPGEHKVTKLELTALAACKQSGRNDLLRLDEASNLDQLLARKEIQDARILYGAQSGSSVTSAFISGVSGVGRIVVVVGPEGGFSADELSLLNSQGAFAVSLSPQILRVETAAIAFAAWLCAGRMSANF